MKKMKEDEKDSLDDDATAENDNEVDVASDEEFEELNVEIKTIDDLIKLGKMYDDIKKEIKEPIQDKDKAKDKPNFTLDKDVKISNFFEMNGKKYSINLEILNKLVKPLTKLQSMIGLELVKNSIIDMILYFLQNFEKRNNNMLHTVIEGPPGVGKTQLGKILAEIYACMGIIKSNKFKLVKRTDLVGEYLGHTANKTQKAIDDADGGVLFIDEAYALGNEDKRDSFSKECIDTLCQNLSENKRKFICIIAGYPDELDKCFFSYNPGLKRRFPFRFRIDGYSADELKDIFIKKIKDIKWTINEETIDKKLLMEFFNKNKEEFQYYGGDIDNLLINCKFAHSRRLAGKHPKYRRKLSKEDLEIGFRQYVNNKKKETNNIYNIMYA